MNAHEWDKKGFNQSQVAVFDIETKINLAVCDDPEAVAIWREGQHAPSNYGADASEKWVQKKLAEMRDKAALSPFLGRIVSIAVGVLDQEDIECFTGEDEREVLQQFLKWWDQSACDILAGWRIRVFDIPFLVARFLARSVYPQKAFPASKDYQRVLDGCDVLTHDHLPHWLYSLGLPPKTAHGSDVATMTMEEIHAYNIADVRSERLLIRKVLPFFQTIYKKA